MLTVHPIESLHRPELAPYRSMRRAAEHERSGIFVAEGEKVVRRLLNTNLKVISVLVTHEWLEILRTSLEKRPEEVRAYVAEKKLLETMVGFQLYHGLLAVAEIPKPASLDDILRVSDPPHLIVALDGLSSSENLGVVVRSCAAFRVQALFVGETCGSPWLRRAVRNSMGGIFHLPAIKTENLAKELHRLAARGFRTIAAHPHHEANTLSQADFTADCCIVFGSEGQGISAAVLQACTERVTVPMPAYVDSLNVASAAAIFLYEVNRQRNKA
jgi:tRNA G18 (ribose-2'-O)-methylase SpoU